MKLSEFDFELPQELIAQEPADERDGSRLLVLDRGSETLSHAVFSDLPGFLPGRPLMVFNDTRVLPARLIGHYEGSGKKAELLLVRECEKDRWEALLKGVAKLEPGTRFVFGEGALTAVFRERARDRGVFDLNYEGDLAAVLKRIAYAPLPPYIRRSGDEPESARSRDQDRYQTVYAATEGAIAAPTAGLHFTDAMLDSLRADHADTVFVTLHVGVGTFQPVRTETVTDHRMQPESFHVSAQAAKKLRAAKQAGQPILAVGSTSTRVLESLELETLSEGETSGWTDRFLYPGQSFNNVDHLLTNFHLPKSTLYLLVCAFAGKETMERAYREAIKNGYRFFSYGDAMLIL